MQKIDRQTDGRGRSDRKTKEIEIRQPDREIIQTYKKEIIEGESVPPYIV